MITRPWITPQDIRGYSDLPDVAARPDAKLAVDISRAEQTVISLTNNRFDAQDLEALPDPVHTAVILVAERFAHQAYLSSQRYKSETLDDWTYTINDTPEGISDLDLSALLKDYVIAEASGSITMRLRKL